MSRLGGRTLRIAQRATRILFAHFKQSNIELADHLNVSRQKVACWLLRGYVSTPAALALDDLAIRGARKHDLRPDVYDWDRVRAGALDLARRSNGSAYPDLDQ